MKFKNKSFYQSIINALRGVKTATISERNLKIQLCILIVTLILGCFLRFSYIDWIAIVLVSVSVIATEMINTAIEMTVDLFCKDTFHPLAKKAKDIAAGAVLVVSIGAFLIGIIIVMPKILNLIK